MASPDLTHPEPAEPVLSGASAITPTRSPSGPSMPSAPGRRRHVRALAGGLLGLSTAWLAGCGGGGSDGESTDVSASPSAGSSSSTATASGNIPPTSGSFGGGQGKILMVAGGTRPKDVVEIDLATRQVRHVVNIARSSLYSLAGGVTRANDGSFVVTDYSISDDGSRIYHCRADGSLIRSFQRNDQHLLGGASLSPDGRWIAFADMVFDVPAGTYTVQQVLKVFVIDLQADTIISGTVIGGAEAPADKTNLLESTAWSADGTLYVFSRVGLFRVDPATAVATRLHTLDLAAPQAAVVSRDGSAIWFEQSAGNPYHPTIWSLNIASGALTRRSIRSTTGKQYAPMQSPDGQWLLMQESELDYLGGTIFDYRYVSAVRQTDPPIDTQNLQVALRNAAGERFTASGRMVWY